MRQWACGLALLLAAGCGAAQAPAGEVGTGKAGEGEAAPARAASLSAWFDCIDQNGAVLVSAHRGTDGLMPENGLASIAEIATRTGGLVEVDVTTSRDGVLFLHHDDRLERTTTGEGVAAETEWRAIKDLSLEDASGRVTAQRVASLKELLVWSGQAGVVPQLDIKRSTDYDDVAAVLRETGAEARVVVIAYSLPQAALIARKMPGVMISATVSERDDLRALQAAGLPANRILAWTGTETPDPALYQALDEVGVEVIFGTLGRDGIDTRIAASGEEAAYAALAEAGVDVIATDRPAEAAAALIAAGRPVAAAVCGRPF